MYLPAITKPPIILTLALFVNILLFLLIQQLVTNEIGEIDSYQDLNWIDFIQLEQQTEQDQQKKQELKPDEPPPEEIPPEIPKMQQPDVAKPQQPQMNIQSPNIDVPFGVDGTPYLGDFLKSAPAKPEITQQEPAIATNIVPTTRIEPTYPPRALRAGVEGSVVVEFTITTDGSVKDLVIIKSNPEDIFDRAVTRAVNKWKFPPQTDNGKKIEKRARQEIKFTLQN